jgi:pyruvate/2-oxoglutarate/acetoin dehydrogenase E1 component
MSKSLRETIKETVRKHLVDFGGLAMGQCLTAVGWVGGTLPEIYEDQGMVELSMADVAGSGFAVGSALAGRRPIYVIRYQGFNWYNAPMIINYACKSKEIWGIPCPMFVRSIAMEGGIGPVAGSSHHSLYYRMPGVKIYSPMTPMEYEIVYKEFMEGDDVFYVSEHRGAYGNSEELVNFTPEKPDFVLLPISITRFACIEAAKELKKIDINVAVHHLFRIKPLGITDELVSALVSAGRGVVLDDDYPDGIAKNIAFDLMELTGAKIAVMGLESRTAGFHPNVDNLPPSHSQIVDLVIQRMRF